MTRTFEDSPAVRTATPCWVGIVGPSSSGKTWSSLRLATGMVRVTGGEVGFIDTEARRALHYASDFRFRHLAFEAPFGSLDYLAAVKHFIAKDCKTIVIDSFSHEHEGPGGLLEQHEAETKRLAALWHVKENVAQLSAWLPCKAARRRMLNDLLQLPVNLIFCLRAKEKLKIVKGKDPEPRGWQAIGAEELIYEQTVSFLLPPGANGVPSWRSDIQDEHAMMKLPGAFRELFGKPEQLNEAHGEALASWSAGVKPANKPTIGEYAACADVAAFADLEDRRSKAWGTYSAADKLAVKTASEAAKARIAKPISADEGP